VKLVLRYDLRAPSQDVPAEAIYAAFLDQCAWADEVGFDEVLLSEHHGSEDGYLPSPLVAAAAVASRTKQMRIVISALVLPLYDPIRAAEDIAVADLLSGGRIDVVIGAGYRPEEYAMFDKELRRRPSLVEQGVEVLKQAWTGEPFEYHGATVRVTPRPVQRPRPRLTLGGSSVAAAVRAARIADGFAPVLPELFGPYADECRRLGRDPGPTPGPEAGPRFLHLAEDPEEMWAQISPHALYEFNSYAAWLHDPAAGPYVPLTDAGLLAAHEMYRVATPAECIEMVRAAGPDCVLSFHPMMGGVPPHLAWASLELLTSRVLPAIRPTADVPR
jgi:alkanesulfonate monooxygenase SsuD/methylene tetrahydromethanopterin reductase-like flavin-dependent oxidoreductase (luciferase family)